MAYPVHKISLARNIDNRLQRIANVLLLNVSFINRLGLLNGRMGIAIFFFQYSRFTGNKIFEDYAGELIDEIYEDIRPVTPLSFEDGLTGIGWGIDYLVKKGFVQANTDDALSYIDNAIYQGRINAPILINNGKELFGYGHYYIKRLTSGKVNDDDLNSLIKKYHLIFLTDECERILVHNQYKGFNIESLSVNIINSFIWFLIEIQQLGIFPYKSEKVLQALPIFIESLLKKYDDVVGLIELVIHKNTGLLCKTLPHSTIQNTLEADDSDLAIPIEYLLRNRGAGLKLAIAVQIQAMQHHSLDEMGDKTFKVYRSLLNTKMIV